MNELTQLFLATPGNVSVDLSVGPPLRSKLKYRILTTTG